MPKVMPKGVCVQKNEFYRKELRGDLEPEGPKEPWKLSELVWVSQSGSTGWGKAACRPSA